MLTPETPFPQVGSYALLIDADAPPPQPLELVRILEHRRARAVGEGGRATQDSDVVMIAFPLREGAGGNKVVAFTDLIDASALTSKEQREFHDLDRALFGRDARNLSKGQRASKKRRDELYHRIIAGPVLDRQLRFARARTARKAA